MHGETLQVLADEAALVGALARLGVVGGLSKAEARRLRPPFRLQQLGPHLAR